MNNVTVPTSSPWTLSNLADLNSKGGTNVALCSNDDFTKYPPWLNGNKPDGSGKTAGSPSAAIIVNDQGGGKVLAFYMYFYNFNKGNDVLGTPTVGLGALRYPGDPCSFWLALHNVTSFAQHCIAVIPKYLPDLGLECCRAP